MSDNISVTEGTGKTVATDDVGGVQYQVVKLDIGAGGASTPVTDLATSAKQDTGNTSAASIDTKTPALGQALAAASVPVILPSATVTTLTPPAAITGFATSAKQDTGNTSLSSIDGKITAVNTGAVVVSSSALPSGAATAAKQPALGTAGTASVDVITVQGKAAMTPVLTDGSATTQPVSLASVPSHAVTNAGTFAVQNTAALPAGTNNIGDVDVLTLPVAFNTGLRSATTQRVTIATDDVVPVTGTFYQATQPVSLASVPSHAVTNAGTFVTQENGAALTAMQLIDDTIFADDAAYTLSTSKASVSSGVAVQTDGTDPTAVSAEGDAAALRTDMQRNLIVNQTHPRFWHVSADYASAQTNASVKAAPGASLSLYITDLQISNGAVAGNVTLLDGSGGTVLYELYPAINGGAVLTLRSPIKLTANTALCITSTTVTTHSIFVSGYIGP